MISVEQRKGKLHTSDEPGAIPIKTNHFSEGSHL